MHSDLNALSAIQFAVELLKVEHIMVVGHYGCSGVQAALDGARIGLADNWIRHIQDVRDRHRALLDSLPDAQRADALCELNVIEQVVNVCVSTVMVDAWAAASASRVHGWVFGVHDGLLQDLHMTVAGTDVDRAGCTARAIDRRHRRAQLAVTQQPDGRKTMFPQRLDSPLAYDIAKAMMDGFNRHYRLFRTESARAKHRFETADWHGQQRAQRERIEFYDLRVKEAVARLEKEFKAGEQPMDVWQQVKLHYIGLLVDHHQPELAETFFNSVTTKILHRTLLPQRLHLRAAGGQHRVHRERRAGRHADLPRLLPDARDAGRHHRAHHRQLPAAVSVRGPAARRRATCSRR